MPEDEDIADNILRVIEENAPIPVEELDLETALVQNLGFHKDTLRNLAFVLNKDEYFKPLGVGLIPDDVADCTTVADLVELIKSELNYEAPVRRKKWTPPPRR